MKRMLSKQYIFLIFCIISSSLKEIHLVGLPLKQSWTVERTESRNKNKDNIEEFLLLV
jgi:hypothetical protein